MRPALSMFRVTALVLTLLSASCATPTGPVFTPLVDAPQDQGIVYIYTPTYVAGGIRVAIDGQYIGSVGKSYQVETLAPGIHVVGVSPSENLLMVNPSSVPFDLNVAVGRSHYVRAAIETCGPYCWRVVFQELDERNALPDLQPLRLQE